MKFTLIAEREQIQDRKAGLKEKGERKKEKGERKKVKGEGLKG